MNFRDLNGRKTGNKTRRYADGALRDMNFRSVRKAKDKSPEKVQEVPEKTVPQSVPVPERNIPPQPASQYMNRPVAPPFSHYQPPPNNYPNSVYIPQSPHIRNAVPPQSVPFQANQNQFLYYTQNNRPVQPSPPTPPEKPIIPVPPQRPPEPEKTDPSKFVEEYVPTPPPKMVKAKPHAVVRKPKNENADFGGFGGTFDGNPDQSTPIADIPVMNNIDDFKI